MEQKPHVPEYGKDEAIKKDLDREMTMEELEAMEVPTIEVVKKGLVESKVKEQRKVDVSGLEHRIKTEEMSLHLLQDKLARETIGGKTAAARATETAIQNKKAQIEVLKRTIMQNGKAGHA